MLGQKGVTTQLLPTLSFLEIAGETQLPEV